MISFLRRPGRRVVITRRIAESAEIADMALVQLSILQTPIGTKMCQDVSRKIVDQGKLARTRGLPCCR